MKNALNPLVAGLSLGILWAVGLFVWTLIASQNGFGGNVLHLLEDLYPWYEVTPMGAILGLLWGFLDGFIGAYLLVWLYNTLAKKLSK